MKKILTFIVNQEQKILLLHNNFDDLSHGGDIWYPVTGAVEKDDIDIYETVKREVKEETNLNVINSMYLNVILKYINKGNLCKEYVFISFVDNNEIVLNEENTEFLWLDIKEFLSLCYWYYDKEMLNKILTYAMNKELYYLEEKEFSFEE